MGDIIAIADIHGEAEKLKQLLAKLDFKKIKRLIFLGDFIDRGPDSKGVIEQIRQLGVNHGKKIVVLAGNHEWLMIDAYTLGQKDLWYMNGGQKTKKSYHGNVYKNDINWAAQLPLQYEEDNFFFSHAPLPFGASEPYTKHQLTWTYSAPYWNPQTYKTFENKVGVCGHIHAIQYGLLHPRFEPEYIFCDAGCGCSDDAPLCAVDVKDRTFLRHDGSEWETEPETVVED